MRMIFGLLCIALAVLGVINLVRNLASGSSSPPPAHVRNVEAYKAGQKVGMVAVPVVFGALGLWLLGGGGSGGARPTPVRRRMPSPSPLARASQAPRRAASTTSVLPLKIECSCGQHYAFDVEPVNGRMPYAVKCPICGADGTEIANGIIAQVMAVPGGPGGGGAQGAVAAPAAGRSKLPWVLAGVAGGVVICLLLVGLALWGFKVRRSFPPAPGPSQARQGPWPRPPQAESGPSAFKKGDKVEVFWAGKWQPGTVTGQRGPTVQVAFDDISSTHIPQIWMITNQVRLRK